MATCSLISSPTPSSQPLHLPSTNSTTLSLSRTFSLLTPQHTHRHTSSITTSSPNPTYSPVSKFIDTCFIFCTSVALSVSVYVTDVDRAAAFVVSTPRKLQTDELATVRLFQDNTPSVVNITNLASKFWLESGRHRWTTTDFWQIRISFDDR